MFGITTLRRRATIAVMVGTIAVSGGVLLASPAYAAEDTLQVITPTADEVLETRTVEVTGSGTPGGVVNVSAVGGDIEVEADGTWQTTVTYADDNPASQLIQVIQTVDGEPAGSVERSFTIPNPDVMFIDTPVDGAIVDDRGPVFTGRAPSEVSITASIGGTVVGSSNPQPDGTFVLQLTLEPGMGGPTEVLFEGRYNLVEGNFDNDAVQPKTRSIVLPESLPAPIVTSPVNTTVTGTTITIAGTATPGRDVYVDLGSPQYATDGFGGSGTADAAGKWSLTVDLPAGNYTGHAYIPIRAENTDDFRADSYVTEFAFSVAAPTVSVPAAGPATPAKAAPHQLAATGSSTDLLLGSGGAMLAFGAVLMLAKRRRSLPATKA